MSEFKLILFGLYPDWSLTCVSLFLLLYRYPSFVDALRDLDDCLTMVHLFAALPAIEGERVQVQRIHNCRRYALFWIIESSLRISHT